MKLKIQFYKPRSRSISFDTVEVGDITSTMSVIKQRDRKMAKRNIPVAPKLHPAAMIELSKVAISSRNSSLLGVTHYLTALLVNKDSSEVFVTIEDIVTDLKLTDKSVIKSLDILEEKTYISRIGRSRFFISPRLAFFGEAFDWSIALEYEKDGQGAILKKINEMREQITLADNKHLDSMVAKVGK